MDAPGDQTDAGEVTDPAPGKRRLRVLVIAEAANPEWVSVPLVGWSLAFALRAHADVHIVTQIRNRDAILRAGLIEGEDFTVIDNEAVAAPVYRLGERLRMGEGKGWTTITALMSRVAYPVFERKVWQRFGREIADGHFDVVHRVTPLTPTANSSLAHKCARAGTPFVLGPLNGGVPWPTGFDSERRREREWLSYVRGIYKLSPGRRRMLKATRAIITGSSYTASDMPGYCADKVTFIPENGIDPTCFNAVSDQRTETPIRGCFVGRLVPYKGPDMLLEAALPHLEQGRLKLDIVGSGPMEDDLRNFVSEKGLEDAVTFHGWLAHDEVQNVLSQANLLTFPSIREFGGGVVLEAMATGVVPVVCDYGGPADLVTDKIGFKIPIGTRAQIVSRYRDALDRILSDPSPLAAIARTGLDTIQTQYTWDRKARQITDIYDWCLTGTGKIPQPFAENR